MFIWDRLNTEAKQNRNKLTGDETLSEIVSADVLLGIKKLADREKNISVTDSIPIIKIECGDKIIERVVDTGSELAIVRNGVVPENFKQPYGSVILKPAFGHKVMLLW